MTPTDMPVETLALDAFQRLPEYSATFPTGTIPGKRWRRFVGRVDSPSGWVIGEYGETFLDERGKEQIQISWRRVVFVDLPEGAGIRTYSGLVEGWSARLPPGSVIVGRTLDSVVTGLCRRQAER